MSRRIIATAVWGMALFCAVSTVPSAQAQVGGRVEASLALQSSTLGRAIPYSIYLPDRSPAGAERLPVLYLLHGRGDDERSWLDKGNIKAILDRGIAEGRFGPLVVVMPAAGDSWYVDDASPDRYGAIAKALTTDLITGIESRYGVGRCRAARAIGGLSMGGYGAILYAFERPDLFAAAFSLSGSLFSEVAGDIERRRPTYERIYGGVFGVPFDAGRFLGQNVFRLLEGIRPPSVLPPVWLAAGSRDIPAILDGTMRLHTKLQQHGYASELHIIDGEHTWQLWQAAIEPALQWVTGQLDTRCTSD